MSSLVNLIKEVGIKAVDSNNPVNVLFGVVVSINPLSVIVDQRFTLPEELLIIPEHMKRYEVNLSHTHDYTDDGSQRTTGEALSTIVIQPGIQENDKLILLRIQGGAKYLVIGKGEDSE